MKRKTLMTLLVIFCVLLAAELVVVGILSHRAGDAVTTEPETTTQVTEVVATETLVATESATEEIPTIAETEVTVPTETEPKEVRYTLTFAGDCTLASDSGNYNSSAGFIQTIGEDYGFPFRNVLEYFENDDFTIINLESVLADSGSAAGKLFTFRGPTAYTQIMTGSSVEAVTLANNHSGDFGKTGYQSTVNALTEAGIGYVEEDKTTLITTESGLTIGLYADAFTFSEADIRTNVKKLKDQGAEVIICAFHWGNEGSYRPTGSQKQFAKAAIDAGADFIYGHHPHVLQPIEKYQDGYICYSLGNFSFGGNHFPRDMDSALVQLEVIRDEAGTVSLGELTIIPVSISSKSGQNNFQPTPYKEGTKEYDRTLTKLDGTFTGPDLVVNYDHLKPTESQPAATEPPATQPPATQPPAEQPPAAEPPATQAPPAAEPPAAEPPATQAPAAPENPAPAPADPPVEPPADLS